MNTYQIKAKSNLHNGGGCFTKGKIYTVETGRRIDTEAALMDCQTINDMGEKHTIGDWWREFELIVGKVADISPDRFKPDATLTICNHGGIEIMFNHSNDGVYYRFNYGQDMEHEEIYEAEIEHEEGGAYFTHGSTQYDLKEFMRV